MNTDQSFIGQSSVAQKLRKFVEKAGKTNSNILLSGPYGSGKMTIATLLHEVSVKKGSLAVLNPRFTPEAEIKATLEKPNPKISTLVLHRIEEFSFLQQTLVARCITQVAKEHSPRIVVTATKDLERLYKDGKIFEALNEALMSFEQVDIPGLGKRTEDIPHLVDYFMRNACKGLGIRPKVLDVNTLDFLIRREWNENIRELRYVMEQAVTSSPEDILELPRHIVDEFAQLEGMVVNIREKKAFSFDKSLSNLEKTLIEKALLVTGNNQRKAAAVLDVSESNLRYRLKKFKILSTRQK